MWNGESARSAAELERTSWHSWCVRRNAISATSIILSSLFIRHKTRIEWHNSANSVFLNAPTVCSVLRLHDAPGTSRNTALPFVYSLAFDAFGRFVSRPRASLADAMNVVVVTLYRQRPRGGPRLVTATPIVTPTSWLNLAGRMYGSECMNTIPRWEKKRENSIAFGGRDKERSRHLLFHLLFILLLLCHRPLEFS